MEQTRHHGPKYSLGFMSEDVVIKVHYVDLQKAAAEKQILLFYLQSFMSSPWSPKVSFV